VGRYRALWGATGLCGALQGSVGRYRALWGATGLCGALQGSVGRYRALWGATGLCGALQGSVGRYRALWGATGLCGALQSSGLCEALQGSTEHYRQAQGLLPSSTTQPLCNSLLPLPTRFYQLATSIYHCCRCCQDFQPGSGFADESVGEEGLDIGEVDLVVCYDAQKTPIRMVRASDSRVATRNGQPSAVATRGSDRPQVQRLRTCVVSSGPRREELGQRTRGL
jgi:hypothetical protein